MPYIPFELREITAEMKKKIEEKQENQRKEEATKRERGLKKDQRFIKAHKTPEFCEMMKELTKT